MAKKKKKEKEKRESEDIADALPETFRSTWDRMPEHMKDYFISAANESRTSEEFVARIMVGSCRRCGSADALMCEQVEGVNDSTVGMCQECGFLWCLECELPVKAGEECPHWQVCRNCNRPRNARGDCGLLPSDCDLMREWRAKSIGTCNIACSWCGRVFEEVREVFVLGAKALRRDIVPDEKGMVDISFRERKKKVPAIIPALNSKARKKGKEFLFVTCCKECGEALGKLLISADSLFEIVF